MTATKHDGGKARLDLIAPEALTALGDVLGFGAAKYAARNWEKGMEWGRVYGAAMRHLNAWQGGEEADPESGFSHLAHALTNIHFLLAFEARGVGTDDRYVQPEADNDDDLLDFVRETTKSGPHYDKPSDEEWEATADDVTMQQAAKTKAAHEYYQSFIRNRLMELDRVSKA